MKTEKKSLKILSIDRYNWLRYMSSKNRLNGFCCTCKFNVHKLMVKKKRKLGSYANNFSSKTFIHETNAWQTTVLVTLV